MEEVAQDVEVVEAQDDGYADGAEPSEPASLDDDTMYQFGDGEPMSGADIKKGYLQHGDYTRKTQTLAEERRAFEQQQQQYQTELQQYVQNLQWQYQQAMQQGQPQQQQGDPLDAIWQAAEGNGGLITVAEAKGLVEQMQQRMGQPNEHVVEAIRQLNARLNQVSEPMQEMLTKRESDKLDNMVTTFLGEQNVPDEFHEQARDIFLDFYRANEPTEQEAQMGKTMESMFHEFAGGRMEAMLKMADAITRSQAQNAQAKLGRVGGSAKPSNSLGPPMTTEEIMARVDPQFK